MKVKVKKEMSLPELIQWAWENGVTDKSKRYVGNKGGQVYFDNVGWFSTEALIEPDETFTVEIEEKVTEETKFPRLIELYYYRESLLITERFDKNIKTSIKTSKALGFKSVAFYLLNDDMTMTLLWKDGEMVE